MRTDSYIPSQPVLAHRDSDALRRARMAGRAIDCGHDCSHDGELEPRKQDTADLPTQPDANAH